jgi:chromosomal replication initiator protein
MHAEPLTGARSRLSPHPEPDPAWTQVRAQLRRAVPEPAFDGWLACLRPVELAPGTLVLAAPDEARRRWIAGRFGRVLRTCAEAVLGPDTTVEVIAGTDPPANRPEAAAPSAPPQADELFNPKLTFEQFVIGDGNRLAHAAALAVAEMPGHAYNPLFIYGPPGNGKTHLLHSIGNYVHAYGAGLTVRYATTEGFTAGFLAALHGAGSMDAFKARFRHVDVLLIDDVQFLASKARTEEEFFHTFNALYDTGSQLVLTSDRLPRDIDAVHDRLRERFEAGLVTDIRPPDLATRLTILRKRAAHDRVPLDDPAALDLIAERITDNIRVLEGALIRVVAFASLTARRLDGALAAEVLDGLYPAHRPARRSTVEDVQRATCEAFGVSEAELVSTARARRLVWPRQVAMFLARELTDQTLPAIGRAFGGRDHTTVLHACRRTAERMAADPEAYRAVQDLTERLRSES